MVLKSELTDKNHIPLKKDKEKSLSKVPWENKDINNHPISKVKG